MYHRYIHGFKLTLSMTSKWKKPRISVFFGIPLFSKWFNQFLFNITFCTPAENMRKVKVFKWFQEESQEYIGKELVTFC